MWHSRPDWYLSREMGDYYFVFNRQSGETHVLNFLAKTVLDLIATNADVPEAVIKLKTEAALDLQSEEISEKLFQQTLTHLDDAGLIFRAGYGEISAIADPFPENHRRSACKIIQREQTLSSLSDQEIWQKLQAGTLAIGAGIFSFSVKAPYKNLIGHLQQCYGDYAVIDQPEDADFHLELKAPSKVRNFFKRQVMPVHTGFDTLMPLPARLAPLSFEMGVNLHVALSMMRCLILHAGAVVNNRGQAILMPAASGRGKSTLTAHLMQQGYRLLSDEFGLLDCLENRKIHAFPRPVSLKNDSIAVVRQQAAAGDVTQDYFDTPKGTIAYRKPRSHDIPSNGEPAFLSLLLFPSYRADAPKGGEAKALTPDEAMLKLIQGATNYKMLGETAFDRMTALVQTVPAYDISYHDCTDVQSFIEHTTFAFRREQ